MRLTDGVLFLRPITGTDAASYAAEETNARVDWLHGGEADPLAVSAYFTRCAQDWDDDAGSVRVFAVTHGVDGELVGVLAVHTAPSSLKQGQAELVYGLHTAWQHPDRAARAVVLGCRYLASSETIHEAVLRVDPTDPDAVVTAKRAGFHFFHTGLSAGAGRTDWYYQGL